MASDSVSDALYALQRSIRRINPWRKEVLHAWAVPPDQVTNWSEWRHDNTPLPLSTEPERLLLTPMHSRHLTACFFDQAQSLLFSRLPIEVRLRIYEYALADGPLHIIQHFRGRRLGYVRCLKQPDEPEEEIHEDYYLSSYHTKCRGTQTGCYVWLRPHPDAPIPRVHTRLLALLKTCKRIYGEAIVILYGRNRFYFHNEDHIIYLKRTTLSHRFNSITMVDVSKMVDNFLYYPGTLETNTHNDEATWEHACEVLAGIHGLRDLHILLKEQNCERYRERHWEARVVQPLCKIKAQREFLLELSWHTLERHLPELQGPFRIVRFDWWSQPER